MSIVTFALAVTLVTGGVAFAAQDVTDAATTAAVKSKFLGDTKVSGLNINVDTRDNVVTLTGTVHSTAEKAEAERLARNTTGVKSVISKLTVDPKKTPANDTKTAAKAEVKDEAKDAKDATKGTTGKAVDATKHGAEKTGEAVKHGAEKTGDAAKKAGHETKDAAVKGEDVTADAATTAAVKTKLLGDTKVGGMKIDVDTKDNVVTLTGTVNSAAEKTEALRLAKNTTGVKRVIDKLTIAPKL
ncbi:MAG TPA: BON domain-containing protein [Vicinamibacterales bacterium]|nr:BON domain-containing protein [Vicinamibacterales bacterium]